MVPNMSAEFPEKMYLPGGFKFSALAAGIKPSGKPDLAIVLMDGGAAAAALFTKNRIVAAPITVGRANLHATRGRVKAVVVNAGNANCSTGAAGLRAALAVCKETAKLLHTRAEQVFPSSTGVIGVPLPHEKITAAIATSLWRHSR